MAGNSLGQREANITIQPDNLHTATLPEGRAGSKRDFWNGFIFWWLFNLCMGGVQYLIVMFGINALASRQPDLLSVLVFGFGCLVLLLNVGGLIFFAARRRQFALGMLAAFCTALAIAILLAAVAGMACFVIESLYK